MYYILLEVGIINYSTFTLALYYITIGYGEYGGPYSPQNEYFDFLFYK